MTNSSSAQVQVDTSTRHDIRIVLTDAALEGIEPTDDVYIAIAGRGREVVRKMNYRDIQNLLGDGVEMRPAPISHKKFR